MAVLCKRDTYMLGVSCVSYGNCENASEDDLPPSSDYVMWCCMVFLEVPFFKRLFRKIDITL